MEHIIHQPEIDPKIRGPNISLSKATKIGDFDFGRVWGRYNLTGNHGRFNQPRIPSPGMILQEKGGYLSPEV